MKQIFIAMHYLEIGGAENALIGLLHALDYSEVSVDLFLYARRGELLSEVPPQVNLLPEIPAYAHIESPLKEFMIWQSLSSPLTTLCSARCAHGRNSAGFIQITPV